MSLQNIAAALQRVERVLRRRPEVGPHDDAGASACWQGGARVVTTHPNGRQLLTDMPKELGGSGEQVTPGWLFRAGFAACAATSIAFKAAARGVDLTTLEVRADSRTDSRGMLGMADADGVPVSAGPFDFQLTVRIGANGVAAEQLRSLVEDAVRCAPVPSAVRDAVPVRLNVQVDTGGA